jgi:GT2 family glycosyltransferase
MILNIIEKYNDIFKDPYPSKPKFLIVEYKNINDVNIKLIFIENDPILIDDIKSFIKVKYGSDGKLINVTDICNKLSMDNLKNKFIFNAKYNNIFGDPYFGKGKTLILKYQNIDNKIIEEKYKENKKIVLININKIISAKYGYDNKFVDVTKKFINYINYDNILEPEPESKLILKSESEIDMNKVSVIIPTYNRFKYLLNTIDSVKKQTYTNFEIIVVNDKSTQKEYYDYDWNANNITIIHLSENSKEKFGFPCAGGYQRNFGIEKSTGKYIAFCDDDDIWFPEKLELQINALKKSECKMCNTDGLIGRGVYDDNNKYKKYNAENYFKTLQNKYKKNNSNLLDNGFPEIWTLDFLKIHNCMILSSVILDREIINKVGKFKIQRKQEDYDYWLRALKHTNSIYLTDICFYYDSGHGNGQEWKK